MVTDKKKLDDLLKEYADDLDDIKNNTGNQNQTSNSRDSQDFGAGGGGESGKKNKGTNEADKNSRWVKDILANVNHFLQKAKDAAKSDNFERAKMSSESALNEVDQLKDKEHLRHCIMDVLDLTKEFADRGDVDSVEEMKTELLNKFIQNVVDAEMDVAAIESYHAELVEKADEKTYHARAHKDISKEAFKATRESGKSFDDEYEKKRQEYLEGIAKGRYNLGDSNEAIVKEQRSFMDTTNKLKPTLSAAEKSWGEGVFTKIKEIQDSINEAGRIAEAAIKDSNPSKLLRAIHLLEQAIEDCGGKKSYKDQEAQAIDLLDRYQHVYQTIFTGFGGIGKRGVLHPYAKDILKYKRDDLEAKRTDFDMLGGALKEYQKDRISRAELDKIRENVFGKHGNASNKDTHDKIKSKLDKALFTGDVKDYDNAFDSVSDEAERAKKASEATAHLSTRIGDMARDRRDLIRRRALTGHKHFTKYSENKMGFTADAAEWIGFDRNPVETLGNLAATIITVWIVMTGIVGPILDVFEFFIPFINILRIPIYLIAIIILHPFMKTILHPIKRDLHFLAGDPYWYETEKEEKKEEEGHVQYDEPIGSNPAPDSEETENDDVRPVLEPERTHEEPVEHQRQSSH